MTEITAQPLNARFNIAIVTSKFNENVTQALYQGAYNRLLELKFSAEQITSVWVPGAVEIPLAAQSLAFTDRYAAIICLGAVIRGETSHFEYVSEQVSYGCQRVALDHEIPVIFGVLTTDTEEQALDRCGGAHGHKGCGAADAACDMISVLGQIESMT